MPLSFENFKQLRDKGLSVQQIKKFEAGHIPQEAIASKKPLPETILSRVEKFGEATFGRAGNFLFGSTGKTVGGLITGGIGAGMQLSKQPETRAKGKKLEEKAMEGITPTNIGFTAIELYPGGGFLTQALKRIKGGDRIATGISKTMEFIPKHLRERAIKQYSEALGATTKPLKIKTEKIVPELLRRKEKIMSLKKISQKAKDIMSTVGENIKKIEKKLPSEKMMIVKPLINDLKKMTNKYIVDGKIINSDAINATTDTMKIITQFGDKISTKSLIKVRRLLDDSIALANKDFTKSEGLTMTMKAKEKLANAIRKELAKDLPDLARVNKEFSLWSNVSKIVNATITRRTTQTGGLTRQIATIGGAVAGVPGGVGKIILGGLAGRGVVKLLQSPLYKTVSAIQKNKLANLISKGDIKKASLYALKILAGLKNITN